MIRPEDKRYSTATDPKQAALCRSPEVHDQTGTHRSPTMSSEPLVSR